MILSGLEIKKQIEAGNIYIDDFSDRQLGPNSYNLRLHNELLVYTDGVLDMKHPNETRRILIPEEGLILVPGTLYLARTVERTATDKYIPMIEGRSSVGRLGISTHASAGFGDIGFNGTWTFQLQVTHPIRVYPFVEIAHIYFHTIEGEFIKYKSKKYQGRTEICPSLLYKDFEVSEGFPLVQTTIPVEVFI
ncbi:MAG: dCTP deaminase [Firmicutes bacterium]|nr:dCTP deaminase [Bacillota bacterium]